MVKRLRRDVISSLREYGITEDAEFEAEVLLETAFGRDYRIKEITEHDKEPTSEELKTLGGLVTRRGRREPLQYIAGEWEFWGISLKVKPGVLIPRQDTETLAKTALSLIRGAERPRVVDLCSGTGCVALAVAKERPDAHVAAVELYPGAYDILRENADRYGGVLTLQKDALKSETAEALRSFDPVFSELDLITANPPYLTAEDMRKLQAEVRYEPKEALFGGDDGLLFYRVIPEIWRDSLKDGGYLAFEIGQGREEDVAELLYGAGYRGISSEKDPAGKTRVIYGRK